MTSIMQKKRGSLRESIQPFCKKRNVIPEVDNKFIILFFKKRLRDSSLIRKLTMKNPRTSKEMLAIATSILWPRRRPSTIETSTEILRRIRSQVHRIDPAPQKAMKRRGS
jgi:hypothetical protein